MTALQVGQMDTREIGGRAEISPTQSGELVCFANDLKLFYFNNSGSLTLTVRRTA